MKRSAAAVVKDVHAVEKIPCDFEALTCRAALIDSDDEAKCRLSGTQVLEVLSYSQETRTLGPRHHNIEVGEVVVGSDGVDEVS